MSATADSDNAATPEAPPASANAFRHRPYLLFWTSRLLGNLAMQIVSVAVGWMVYDITRDPFDLGLVGLVQFLPSLALVLVTGSVADRYSRKLIMLLCLLLEAAAALVLLEMALRPQLHDVWPVFVVLFFFGLARAFFAPASQALVPNLVPPVALASAITWASSAWQLATILGPVAGGLLYGISAATAYGTATAMLAVAAVAIGLVPLAARIGSREPASWSTVAAGFRYIRSQPVVFGAISLDLFAVLMGGATALLPAVARDVLDTGPWGLGLLRAAPGIGALAMAGFLALVPIRDHAGRIMFAAVALFGAGIVLFGLSTSVWLSIAALVLMGATDMVSVVVRETLIQLWTPDAVRGRVSAVNMVFVGASNELGEFRAGTMAALIGVMPAIVVGGFGTLAVAGIWAWAFPALREARRLDRKVA